MAIKLHKPGYDRALSMIEEGLEVEHDENNWDEVKATQDEEVRYLEAHSLQEYGEWFLGVNTDPELQNDRRKYSYPFGDFSVLHKSALIAAEQQAEQNSEAEIQTAASDLLERLE